MIAYFGELTLGWSLSLPVLILCKRAASQLLCKAAQGRALMSVLHSLGHRNPERSERSS